MVILINASFTTVNRKPTAWQLVTPARQLDDTHWDARQHAALCKLTGGQLQIRNQVRRSKRTANGLAINSRHISMTDD